MKDVKEYPRLNLGSGFDYQQSYINVDKDKKQFKLDLELDLETAKLPYENGSVEIVRACHILEHISNFIPLMKEIHRVLKKDGCLYILAPEFPCAAAIADPTHVRYFVPESFYLWTHNRPAGPDTENIGGLFNLAWLESKVHDNGQCDRGRVGNWFREIEVELTKIGSGE